MTEAIWQLQICVCERGIGWFFEKCGSRKTLAWSQNLGSVCDSSQSLLFGWFCILDSRFFLSLGLEFWNPGHAVLQSLEFTILYPLWGVRLVDYGGRGVEDGEKEKVLRFQAPVVQWVDSTTHWLNLCLCPEDNAIIAIIAFSLILIYWVVPILSFLTTEARLPEFGIYQGGA